MYKNLKKTLTEEEFIYYFKEFKKGNMNAKNIIIEHNLRLILTNVRKFENTEYDLEDLCEISVIGLSKAVDTYDLNKNIKFSTYACACMNNEIFMFLRKNKKHKAVNSLYENVSQNDECVKSIRLIDTIYDDFDFTTIYEEKILYERLNNILETLPERSKEIIKLYFGFYGKIYNQDEIAKKMNISQSYISRLITKELKFIGQKLNNEGLIYYKVKK